jgi:hypothetical protein
MLGGGVGALLECDFSLSAGIGVWWSCSKEIYLGVYSRRIKTSSTYSYFYLFIYLEN